MFTKAIAVLLALPFVARIVSADNSCTRSYTAQAGDTCDSISAANNVSTYQFAVVNYGTVDQYCSNLVPGQSYCLGWQGEDCVTTYVVKAGDDCDIVASAVNINTTILYENNPQINSNCSNMYIKEVLCTAGTVQVPPAPDGNVAGTPSTATLAVNPTTAYNQPLSATPYVTPTPTVDSTPSPTPTVNSTPSPTPTDDSNDDESGLPWCD